MTQIIIRREESAAMRELRERLASIGGQASQSVQTAVSMEESEAAREARIMNDPSAWSEQSTESILPREN